MDFAIEKGLLRGARQINSPNQSERPAGLEVDLLVIHNISLPPGEFGGNFVEQLFCNNLDKNHHPYFCEIAHLQVSAHLFVDREGLVTQFVPFNQKAWHAGESEFCGKSACNDYSIGIELEGTDFEPFTNSQYEVLTTISALLMQTYPRLILDRIVGHSDIAPARKTDPGPYFDWVKYKAALHEAIQKAVQTSAERSE